MKTLNAVIKSTNTDTNTHTDKDTGMAHGNFKRIYRTPAYDKTIFFNSICIWIFYPKTTKTNGNLPIKNNNNNGNSTISTELIHDLNSSWPQLTS